MVKNKAPLSNLWICTAARIQTGYMGLRMLVDSGDGGSEASKVDECLKENELLDRNKGGPWTKVSMNWRTGVRGITGQANWIQIHLNRDFPGSPVVGNLPSNAREGGSIPGRGTKILYTTGQLSPGATTREPHGLQLRSPRTTARESPCATMKTQCRQHLIKTEGNNRKCQLLSIVLGLGEGKKSVQNPKHTDEV